MHTVDLDEFYIDKYEVTNAQYARFLSEYGKNTDAAGHKLLDISSGNCLIEKNGDTYRPKPGYENHPVIMVSWYGAAAYAQSYGKRLPTEAQWEKAARGGLVKGRFPWGNDAPDGSQCNFADKNLDRSWSDKNADDGYERTSPVGSYQGHGLHDMAGNVWEWCADEYSLGYYGESPKDNPMGPGVSIAFDDGDFTNIDVGNARVMRGGSWFSDPYSLRTANRYNLSPTYTDNNVGFRCVAQD